MSLQIAPNTATIAAEPKIDIETLVEMTLPPSPGNIMRLSRLLGDEDTSVREITQAIGYEPMLAARILRLANSTIYGLERNVTSIQAAIAAVGNKILGEIVLMELASSTFAKQIRSSFFARKIWEHSLAVAMISRETAQILQMKGTEEVFTCGLLHDLGKLILLSYDFKGFPLIQGENDEEKMLEGERLHYGYDHAQIGSLVACRWNLQTEICNSIQNHHSPAMAECASMVTHIVEVADIVANSRAYGLRMENKDRLLNCESVAKLNLTPENLELIWGRAQERIREAIYSYA
ncbi:MAG: HDOD domain-containing protein [Pyrinomonadaceae bacterium]|nr:HDOD domain-containing protein [Pyrinomonadaceae bacterium]